MDDRRREVFAEVLPDVAEHDGSAIEVGAEFGRTAQASGRYREWGDQHQGDRKNERRPSAYVRVIRHLIPPPSLPG
jgi:hypothetical protein